jgi:glucose/mannose-6-phosphate isomerase
MENVLPFSKTPREVLQAYREVITASNPEERLELWEKRKRLLFELTQTFFGAEIIALFVVKGSEVRLDAHIGYQRSEGDTALSKEELESKLIYQITPPERWGSEPFDGITGLVASRGDEFSADSWEEVRQNFSHRGKPDQLGIWSDHHPFRNMFAVPLTLGSQIIGVLKVENKTADGQPSRFTTEDKSLLRNIARLISFVVAQANDLNDLSVHRNSGADVLHSCESVRESLVQLATRYDESRMEAVIEGIPDQIAFALDDPDFPEIPSGAFDCAVVLGMGGSALAMDVIAEAFSNELRPGQLVSWRRYERPPTYSDTRSLFIANSFSGNTEETLSAVEALPEGEDVVVITAGGQLAEFAHKNARPLIRIPADRERPGFQPRSATGYFVTYLARLLNLAGLLPNVRSRLESLPHFLMDRNAEIREHAEEIAIWLEPKIPVIYTDDRYERSIGRIAKIKINENAKRPAFNNVLPEANHNEMISFSRPYGIMGVEGPSTRFGFLYLKDPSSLPRIHQRFDALRQLFVKEHYNHLDFRSWDIPGETNLERIFAALTFADWCSYTLALLDGIDPTPVREVEEFKGLLRRF